MKQYRVRFLMKSDLGGTSYSNPPFFVVASDEAGAILSALSKLSEMHAAMIVPGEPPDVRLPRGGEFKKFWRVHYQAYPGLTQIWECTANSAEHARSLAYTRGDIDPSNISKIEPLFDE